MGHGARCSVVGGRWSVVGGRWSAFGVRCSVPLCSVLGANMEPTDAGGQACHVRGAGGCGETAMKLDSMKLDSSSMELDLVEVNG